MESHLDIAPHIVHLATEVQFQPMTVAHGKILGYRLSLRKTASNKAQALGLGFDVVTLQ